MRVFQTPLTASILLATAVVAAQTARPARFVAEEATIKSIQSALMARQTTCVDVTQAYLDRIEAYDDKGPALNAIITVNP